jgi:hypothetical protein
MSFTLSVFIADTGIEHRGYHPKRVRKYFFLLPVFFSFPLSLLSHKHLSRSVIAFSSTLRARCWDISKIIFSIVSKVRSLIGILTLTSGKIMVIVSVIHGCNLPPFLKDFVVLGKSRPFSYSLQPSLPSIYYPTKFYTNNNNYYLLHYILRD